MSFIVKITTKSPILDLFCPFHCKKCGHLGRPLCECCKKYITKQNSKNHQLQDFVDCCEGWTCGWRDEIPGQLAQDYKYHSTRAIGPILAELLAAIIPDLGPDVIIVPLPTNTKHIRERGFDHTQKIAKYLARLRNWQYQPILRREQNTVQVGTSLNERHQQAECAYSLNPKFKIDPTKTYLLLDDIVTTGATILAATDLLKNKKAHKIYAATIAVSR